VKRQHTLAELVRWKGKAAPEVVVAVVELLRELDQLRAERDLFREAWANAQARLDVIERGAHDREEEE